MSQKTNRILTCPPARCGIVPPVEVILQARVGVERLAGCGVRDYLSGLSEFEWPGVRWE